MVFVRQSLERVKVLQVKTWRQLSLDGRMWMMFAMIGAGFALVAASIRATHPECTPEEFRTASRKRISGDETLPLTRGLW